MRKPPASRAQTDHLSTSEKKILLNFGCGSGLYAEEFYRHGFTVTGVDLSRRSITYAKKQAKDKNHSICDRCQDYFEFETEENFDIITLIYCDFGVLSDVLREHICLDSFYRYDATHAYLRQIAVITEDAIKSYHIWEHVFSQISLKKELRNAGFKNMRFWGDITGKVNSRHCKTLCAAVQK